MSQLNVNAIRSANGTGDAISLAAASNTCTANITNNLSNRNLIINGAMTVAQTRGSSTTGTGIKILDRWNCYASSGSWAWTSTQDTDSPDGFSNSFKIDVTTAHTPAAAEYFSLQQRIEACDLQHLLNGSAGAKKLTLSFWVKSPKTGNHAVALYKPDNTTRIQTKTYSVSAANTWEKKTITYDGDTAGGGITNDNGTGLQIDFHLAVGSDYTSTDSTSWINYADAAWAYGHAVNITDNTANNFYLTGVQLETGDFGSDYCHENYGQTFRKCCRYFYAFRPAGSFWRDGYSDGNIYIPGYVWFPVQMRTNPTDVMIGTMTHGNNESGGDALAEAPYTKQDYAYSYVRSNSSGRTYSYWNTYVDGVGFTFSAEL